MVLNKKAQETLVVDISRPPIAGPTILARLKITELIAMAGVISFLETIFTTRETLDAWFRAFVVPAISMKRKRMNGVIWLEKVNMHNPNDIKQTTI